MTTRATTGSTAVPSPAVLSPTPVAGRQDATKHLLPSVVLHLQGALLAVAMVKRRNQLAAELRKRRAA